MVAMATAAAPAFDLYDLRIPSCADATRPYVARIPMSEAHFIGWDHGNRLAEWVDGEAFLYMSTTLLHEQILILLTTLLSGFCEVLSAGVVVRAPYAMRAVRGRPVREPDLVVITSEHADRLTNALLEGPADIVVEVISPDSPRRDRVTKLAEYEAAGIPEYWLIDSRPRKREARFFVLEGGKYFELPVVEGVVRSRALPGFWLRPEWLWGPETKALHHLAEIIGAERLIGAITARAPRP